MDVLQKIDSLQVSDSWKVKFKTIAEASPLSYGLILKFEKNDAWRKASLWTKFNPLAMLFGIFYYITKGMWKKGVLLLLVGIALGVLVEAIFGEKFLNFFAYGYNAVYATYANLDFYRKKVLDEDFWL